MRALHDSIHKQAPVSGTIGIKHLLLACAVAVITLGHGGAAWANEIDECDVFIEINATDEDAGWQGFVDADPWFAARIIGPEEEDDDDYWDWGSDWETKLVARARGSAAKQGLTEYRWESGEPTFDELLLQEFLERFPAGVYKCKVIFIEGYPWRAAEEDELTHCLPDGPDIILPNDTLPAGVDWTVMWNPVTTQYDQDGPGAGDSLDSCDPEDELVKYTVTVEFENDEEKVMTFDVLPQNDNDGVQMAGVSGDFLECGLEGKVEIGAVLDSGNASFREKPIDTSQC